MSCSTCRVVGSASARTGGRAGTAAIKLKLSIDTHYGEIGEYFEIFMERMLLCKKAANFLGMDFHLIINEQTLL